MKKKLSPYMIMIIGFVAVILIGTGLLLLPFATKEGITLSFIDAIFTATSAVCVTGLVSVSSIASVYTVFGKIVIALLIEIGGLGFITIVIFIFSVLGIKIGMADRFLVKESLNQNSLKGMVRLVRTTIFITLVVQTAGAIINFIVFIQDYPFWDAIGISVFHSISAFNNAGFDLLGSSSLISYTDNVLLNLNTMALVILGGIGFIVIYDVLKNRQWNELSIHSQIVLKTSAFLIILGAIALKLFEGANIGWLEAFFNSVTARTAGFSTINFDFLSNSSLLIIMILMYIGASPSSAGGGIKTTTFYTIFKYIFSFARHKVPLTHHRKIANSSISKAIVLVVFSLSYIFMAILLVNAIEAKHFIETSNQHHFFTQVVFEVFSAFGTVGNSMGITKGLSGASKLVICLTMLLGRIGPITVITAFGRNVNVENVHGIKYIDERIIIG
ncbi:MAG: potassium transporter TrkG [Bacilli bacterium]|nr:potassium transporter TrkG [Bacilli bacterium]